MDYFIHPIWFYLMSLCDKLNDIALIVAVFSIIIFACCKTYFVMEDIEEGNILKILLISFIISVIIGTFVPDKDTCMEMMIASVATKENYKAAKTDVKDFIDYIVDRIEKEEKENEE